MENIDVFVCEKCGYEDSSIIPFVRPDRTICECSKCGKEVAKNIVKMPIGKNMTLQEYLDLLQFIEENHSFRRMKGKRIKYIGHTYDFRTHEIFSIRIDNVTFTKVNENRHKNLKEWVMNYING